MKDKRDFAEIIHDAKFEVVGAGDMPKGEYFWCAFCGGRGIHFVLLKRLTDNSTWKVGKTCIGRVGLTLPKSVKKVVIKREEDVGSQTVRDRLNVSKKAEPKPKEKEAEKPKKKETKEPKAEELKKEEVSSEDIENIFEELD